MYNIKVSTIYLEKETSMKLTTKMFLTMCVFSLCTSLLSAATDYEDDELKERTMIKAQAAADTAAKTAVDVAARTAVDAAAKAKTAADTAAKTKIEADVTAKAAADTAVKAKTAADAAARALAEEIAKRVAKEAARLK
jgi:hypothetical protein